MKILVQKQKQDIGLVRSGNMRAKEFLTESTSMDDASKIIGTFLKFAKQHLELEELPEINLITNPKYSIKMHSFGGYSPDNKSINIMVSNRHIQDVLRTLAHELVHYRQDLNGQLKPDSGKDGSPEENEANSNAAVIMRKWGRLHPSVFGKEALE